MTSRATGTPPLRRLAEVNPSQTSYMRALGAGPYGSSPREPAEWAPLAAISPLLVAAVVKSEDPRFFLHRGVDWLTSLHIVRASIRDRRLIGGASTITQQLARNLYLTASRSVVRKVREIAVALRMERHVSKTRILELYLNLVEWGGGAWGCVAASAHYFGKAPRDLDLFESTFLVSLLPAPRSGVSGRHAQRSRQQQFRVANLMLLSGLIDPECCAACIQRIEEFHRLVAEGMPLIAALESSKQAAASTDAKFLRELVTAIGVEPVAGAAMLPSQCGFEQQQAAALRLQGRFGAAALREVLTTASYDPLRLAMQAVHASRARDA